MYKGIHLCYLPKSCKEPSDVGAINIPSLKQGTGAQRNGIPPTKPCTLKVVEPVFEGSLVLGALPLATALLQGTKDFECIVLGGM